MFEMLAVPECADSGSSPVSHGYPHCFTPGSRFLMVQPFGYVEHSLEFRAVPPVPLQQSRGAAGI